jgi:hypothetical protein
VEVTLGAGAPLSAGVEYVIQCRPDAPDANNYLQWRGQYTTPTYTRGTFVSSSDGGSTWTVYNYDCNFEEWGGVFVEKTASDSGSGSETSIKGQSINKIDSGSGIDAKTLIAALAKVESGTGSEASIKELSMNKVDSGSGVDTKVLTAVLTKVDSGAGSEASILPLKQLTKSDSGVGIDTKVAYPTAVLTKVDFGVGADAKVAYPAVVLTKVDFGIGADAKVAYPTITITKNDQGSSDQVLEG